MLTLGEFEKSNMVAIGIAQYLKNMDLRHFEHNWTQKNELNQLKDVGVKHKCNQKNKITVLNGLYGYLSYLS